LKKKIKSLYPY